MKNAWIWVSLAVVLVIYSQKEERVSQPNQSEFSRPTTMPVTSPTQPLTFKGYECTVDCSGHEAGYAWAEENGIDDPDACGGKSQSFIEGCKAYAEEQQDMEDEE